MAPDRERSRSPMGRSPLPATVMNVKMCCAKCEEKAIEECEEVKGVVKVVTKASENKVIVYGAADPSVLLKKMRRHLDKHAMLWPMDEGDQGQVAPPLFPVDPRELQNQERNPGGPSLQTGTAVRLDPRDGRPLVDSRDVRQVERELKDAEMRGGPHGDPREAMSHGPRPPLAADLVHPLERMELRGERPGDPYHGPPGPAPREVVFIPVDARDGRPITPPGHGPELRPVLDPRDPPVVLQLGRPVDASGLRPLDPRDMARHGDPREAQRMDPHVVMRPREALGPRDDLRPVDPRMVRPIDPRDGRPALDPRAAAGAYGPPEPLLRGALDPRDMDPRDGRAAAGAYGPLEPPPRGALDPRDMDPRDGRAAAGAYGPLEPPPRGALDPRDMDPRAAAGAYGPPEPPPRGAMRGGVPEGLVPVRTGRDPREVHFAPSRGDNLSPTHAAMGPRSPRDAEYMARSPRQQQAPDYGPRSPREDYGPPDYAAGPRSPRFEGAADYGGSRSPRFEGAADYSGSRSPRFDGAADYSGSRSAMPADYSGPRSPRGRGGYEPVPQRGPAMRPALDRELSFNDYAPDLRGAAAMEAPGRGMPAPYMPVDPRDAAAFDFHGGGGGGGGGGSRSPRSGGLGDQVQQVRGYGGGGAGGSRSPRSGGLGDQGQQVRGYGDIDPRQLRPAAVEPRVLLDVTDELQGGSGMRERGDGMSYRRGGLEGSPRQHVSQYSEFGPGEADTRRDYQPNESYFSDYRPSQNYQPGSLATQEIDELPATNPNYQKHLNTGFDQF